MNPKDKKEEQRPFAYPKPTENDEQLRNQPEFIDQEPNRYDKEISDIPGEETNKQESRDPNLNRGA
jgi:hypothetical protein